jgi:flavorubredoxin
VSVNDFAARPAHPLGDGQVLSIGGHDLEWIDAPHVPHNWETGYLFDRTTKVLFCGDLFTQGGWKNPALTDRDILGPSEAFRIGFATKMPDYYSHTRSARPIFARLAATQPGTLACMHGSAWSGRNGDGAELLMKLAEAVEA